MCEKHFTMKQLKMLYPKFIAECGYVTGGFIKWLEDKCPYCGRVINVDNAGVRGKCSKCWKNVEHGGGI